MGFYNWRMMTMLKGKWPTAIKERMGINRIEREGGHATKMAFDEFPKLIEEDHMITRFYGRFPRFLASIKTVCHNCVNVIANQMTQDMTEVQDEDGVVRQMADHWTKMPKIENLKDAERNSLLKIADYDKEDELKERTEYQEVEAVINQARKMKTDRRGFMLWLRTRVKNNVQLRNVLERFAWRSGVSSSLRKIRSTETLRDRVEKVLNKIVKEKDLAKAKGLSRELKNDLDKVCEEIRTYFQESYKVKERAILMILRVIYVVEAVDAWLVKMEEQHNVPLVQTEDAREKLSHLIEEEIGKPFHDLLAQEYRILIHDLEIEESKARKLARTA